MSGFVNFPARTAHGITIRDIFGTRGASWGVYPMSFPALLDAAKREKGLFLRPNNQKTTMKTFHGSLTLLCSVLLLTPVPKAAKGDIIDEQIPLDQPITLGWDPVPWSDTDLPEKQIVGYMLEYNSEGSSIWSRIGLYRTPEINMPRLPAGGWHFRVRGVLANGLETDASDPLAVWLK